VKKSEQFLKTVYSSLTKRSDSYLELGLALASSSQIESVVRLSESPLYRRKFSSIYETFSEVEWNPATLLKAELDLFNESCETLSGYEVYSGDSTFIKRNEAKTLASRVMKRFSNGEFAYGHESYWLLRLSKPKNSWAGVALVERMAETDTVTNMAAKQMRQLATQHVNKKLFVFDAGHGLDLLQAQQACHNTEVILRVKGHQVFYYPPTYKGQGRPPKVGERFKLSDVKKDADSQQTVTFKNKPLRISTWTGLQTAQFMDIPLMILKLEFLDSTGKPVFDKPIWLVTTATHLEAETLARAYLWRASHELSFRFMKQHLGLCTNNSPELKSCDAWFQVVALAMNLLLAIRDELEIQTKPWYPQPTTQSVSQRQAQTQALPFFLMLPPVTKSPQLAGKAPGRLLGYLPPRRIRHEVIRKTPKRHKPCPTCPFKLAT
jgi:DDE superfamily endonuclease